MCCLHSSGFTPFKISGFFFLLIISNGFELMTNCVIISALLTVLIWPHNLWGIETNLFTVQKTQNKDKEKKNER